MLPLQETSYIRIWQTVQLIPYGRVATYGQVADLAGLPGRARLVGKALGHAPKNGWQGKAIPWFRVINALGKISFAPASVAFERQKNYLLDENIVVIGGKIKLPEYRWQPDLSQILYELPY